jgi:hypothetical protein
VLWARRGSADPRASGGSREDGFFLLFKLFRSIFHITNLLLPKCHILQQQKYYLSAMIQCTCTEINKNKSTFR